MAHLGLSDPCGFTSGAVDALFTTQGNFRVRKCGRFIGVRVAKHSPLLREVIDVIARGECGTTTTAPDPLLDWAFEGRTEGICGPLPQAPSQRREVWFHWLTEYCVLFGAARGGVYALLDPETKRVVAAAVTGPPNTVSFDRGIDAHNIRKAGGGSMAMGAEVLLNPRMQSLGLWQHGMQSSKGYGSHRNWLYVVILATAPECQGQGCGAALLNLLGEVADADGVESFLETAGARNVGFYANKGGYEEVGRSPIAGFTHEGGGVGMLRPRDAALRAAKVSKTRPTVPSEASALPPLRERRPDARSRTPRAAEKEAAPTAPAAAVRTASAAPPRVRTPTPPDSKTKSAAAEILQPRTPRSVKPSLPDGSPPKSREIPQGKAAPAEGTKVVTPPKGNPARTYSAASRKPHAFKPRRPTGPLASWCIYCGEHKAQCEAAAKKAAA